MTTVIMILMVMVVLLLIVFILKRNAISDRNKEDIFEKTSNNKINSADFYSSGNFELEIEDVFSITGRGTVVTGLIKSGVIRKGDKVFIKKTNGAVIEDTVTGIESMRKILDTGEAGGHVGLLLKNSKRNDLERGDKVTK
ncbi:EF-Tu/IF-2/RF-3 family GTPase [Sebaldella sp. S0638]|uniref:EF-Tu/IF-2/RF-3 family GTPase n=1 Tax=Sebaldella sp. S0638 TaxID=2957809 RepID=UPI0020A0A71C|nr:EF-Tu/IF-2/RF-3 family GTPase [Sebaldella sp. S0638]MCP1224642.1 EF-Tu/IF-2/RF-3 family GTPase [Sebaldella sp. S0638]